MFKVWHSFLLYVLYIVTETPRKGTSVTSVCACVKAFLSGTVLKVILNLAALQLRPETDRAPFVIFHHRLSKRDFPIFLGGGAKGTPSSGRNVAR